VLVAVGPNATRQPARQVDLHVRRVSDKVSAVPESLLEDAFGHHVWATLQIIDQCASLDPEELASPIPGTYGSILDTVRHTVGADAWYLNVISGGTVPNIDEDAMQLHELRAVMQGHGPAWSSILRDPPDPAAEIVAHRRDGSTGHAPASIRLAQALHHGSDHRSQICTGLTALGREPPEFDVWAFGGGRVFDLPAPE
jgi:uncharacterized damage-inducible protein DinB